MSEFKSKYTFEQRQDEASRILNKYPDRVPVIVEMYRNGSTPSLDRNRFLVPADLTMGQLTYIIRKRIKLPSEQALYTFVGNSFMNAQFTIGDVYEKNKDLDGFLYIVASVENVFG